MHIVIAGGTGFIGRALVAYLLEQQNKISVIGRDVNKINQLFKQQVNAISWHQLKQKDGARYLQEVDVVINLAGSNIGRHRWNPDYQQEIIESRVHATQLLAKLCAQQQNSALTLLNANGVGVYGLQAISKQGLPPALDEQSATPLEAATDFLAITGRRWEQATEAAETANIRVVKMRFAAVLGRNGGVLANMLPVFRCGLGGKIGNGNQPFSWVALDDVIKAIGFIISQQEIHGPVNIVAPETIMQKDFAKTLADILHRPCLFNLPAWLVKLLFGQMGEELLLQGQHIKPQVLLDHGFVFDYPKLQSALLHILQKSA